MKKNGILIFLGIFILGLIMKKLSLPLSDQILILGTIGYSIAFLIFGIKQLITDELSILLKITFFVSSVYLAFTLVGIVYRHMWWRISNYTLLFWVIWPILTLAVVILITIFIIIQFKKEDSKYKRSFIKNLIIPLFFILFVSIPSFFTSTETFCKIFKAYTAEQLYEKWDVRKNSGN